MRRETLPGLCALLRPSRKEAALAQLSGLWPQHGTAVLRCLRESGLTALMLWLLQELEPALDTFCDLAQAEGGDEDRHVQSIWNTFKG